MAIDIGISETDRKQIADGLSHLLADTYTLYLKTHNFQVNDEPTTDLLTQRVQVHEKTAWMLRSLLEK